MIFILLSVQDVAVQDSAAACLCRHSQPSQAVACNRRLCWLPHTNTDIATSNHGVEIMV